MNNISTDEGASGRLLTNDDEVLEWCPVAHRSFERDDEGDLSTAITAAVADAEGVSVTAITSSPLFEAVDIFALEELFFDHPNSGTSRDCDGQVQFRYRGFRVTVTSAGRITVAEPVREAPSCE